MPSDEENLQNTFQADPPLAPGYHGKDCLGNGSYPGVECCCDECDFFLTCFPDWRSKL